MSLVGKATALVVLGLGLEWAEAPQIGAVQADDGGRKDGALNATHQRRELRVLLNRKTLLLSSPIGRRKVERECPFLPTTSNKQVLSSIMLTKELMVIVRKSP
jgi:hypothetical protein